MMFHGWLPGRSGLLGMLLLISLFSLAGESYAQWGPCPFGWTGHGMMGGVWGWIGGIVMMVFWILVIVGMVLLIRWFITAGGNRRLLPPGQGESAMDILKKRYARGEITKEQFESMRRDLE